MTSSPVIATNETTLQSRRLMGIAAPLHPLQCGSWVRAAKARAPATPAAAVDWRRANRRIQDRGGVRPAPFARHLHDRNRQAFLRGWFGDADPGGRRRRVMVDVLAGGDQ